MTTTELKELLGQVATTLRQNEAIATSSFLTKCEELVGILRNLFNTTSMNREDAIDILSKIEQAINMEREFIAGPSKKLIDLCDGLQNRKLLLCVIAKLL